MNLSVKRFKMKTMSSRIQRYCLALLTILMISSGHAIVPIPAADQSGPIAIIGAIIHVGNGNVIGDGVITFDDGIITAIGQASDPIDLTNHQVIDLQGQHVYPDLCCPILLWGYWKLVISAPLKMCLKRVISMPV